MSNQLTTFYYKLYDAISELNLVSSFQWTNQEKYVLDVVLNNSSYTVDLSFLEGSRFIFFLSDQPFKISMTISGSTVVYNVQNFFAFTPVSDFMSDVTSIVISTSDPVDTIVNVKAFGEYLAPNADALVFTPITGSYTGTQSVTITGNTIGTSIRYTVDGTTPDRINGTLYTGAFSVAVSETVKAVSYADGYALSMVVSATYTIT